MSTQTAQRDAIVVTGLDAAIGIAFGVLTVGSVGFSAFCALVGVVTGIVAINAVDRLFETTSPKRTLLLSLPLLALLLGAAWLKAAHGPL